MDLIFSTSKHLQYIYTIPWSLKIAISHSNLFVYSSVFKHFCHAAKQFWRQCLFLLVFLTVYLVLVRITSHIMKSDIAFWELPTTLARVMRTRSTALLYLRLARVAWELLKAIIVFRVVFSTWLHLIVATSVIIDVLVCVVCVSIKLLELTGSSTVLSYLYSESTLPVIEWLVVIICIIIVMALLMHHLPCCLQSTISYLLLGIKFFGFSHRRFFLFLHFKHLFLVL